MKNNKWSLISYKNKNGTNGNKNWPHDPVALTNGHVAYKVQFLGVTETDSPKGIDVVKECIRKLKLDEEIRRAEGLKTKKAEVTISIDGVAVQEPKAQNGNKKKILHQFPLHQISYCADDKAEKKYFTFIAKEGDSHQCFVFASDKLALEITLTVGMAFDLAWKKFLDSSGHELELKREIMVLQKRIAELENENTDLKQKLVLNPDTNSNASTSSMSDSSVDLLFSSLPPVPPRTSINQVIAEFAMTANEIEKRANQGRQQENGLLSLDEELDSIHTSNEIGAPPKIFLPPPKGKKQETLSINNHNGINNGLLTSSNGNGSTADIFGSDPFFTTPATTTAASTVSADPFGMDSFSPNHNESSLNGVKSLNMTNGTNTLLSSALTSTTFPTSNHNNVFNTSNMNLLNEFSFQQKPQIQPIKPSSDGLDKDLDKKIEEIKLGFSRGILTDSF